MVKKKKMVIHFFYSCLEWHANYSEYWHAIRRVSITRPSLFYFSLRISQSLNGGLYQKGTNTFFPLLNFGSSWTARAKLLLSGLDITLITALHTCNVSHHLTWIGTFSKWPSIKRQKKFVENLVSHNISFIAHLGFLNLRGMCWDNERGKIWRQLPFK